MAKLSVVIPVYGQDLKLKELSRSILEMCTDFESAEIVYVDDGNPYDSWPQILELADTQPEIVGVQLSRNFGQHMAIIAGIEQSTGDYVVVMDCDFQDHPKYIPEMYKLLQGEKIDFVLTGKHNRAHHWFKNVTASLFALTIRLISNSRYYHPNIGSYSLLSRRVADAFLKIGDVQSHYLMTVMWLGFRYKVLEVDHYERAGSGKSSYTFSRLFKHALVGIVAHSNKVLYYMIGLGAIIVLTAFLGGLSVIVLYFLSKLQSGWPSLVVIQLFSLGSLMVALGVIGIYIGSIFDQVKKRPLYLIREVVKKSTPPK